MIRIVKTLFYLTWIALFFINEFFQTIPFGYYIALGIFGLYLVAYFTMSLIKSKSLSKNKWQTAFRRHCLLGWICTLVFFNHQIFESMFNIFLLALLIIVPLISISASYAIRKLTKIDSFVETKDEFLHKDSDLVFKVKFDVPSWYKYIPFNLGNVKIRFSYGIDGEPLKEQVVCISGNKDIELKLDFKYKGIFKVGVAQIEITDCLLLTTITKKYDFKELKVYPKVSKLRFSNFIHKDGETEQMQQRIKRGEKYDTREYSAGDNLKRVNWKLFARQNELYVRDSEISSFIGNRIIFYDNRRVFDDERQKYVDEKMAEVIVSLASVFIHNGEKHSIYYYSADDRLIKHEFKHESFSERYEVLSFIPLVESISKRQQGEVRKIIHKNYLGSEMIFLTSKQDESINETIRMFSNSKNYRLRVISIASLIPTEESIEIKKTAKYSGIPFMEVPLSASVSDFDKEMLE